MNNKIKKLEQSGTAVIGDPGRAAQQIGPGLPPREPYPTDIASSAYETDSVSIRAASVQGVQHRNSNQPRQDEFSIAANEDDTLIVALVCDGVGSLKYSHEAAAYVCRYLPERVLTTRSWQIAVEAVNVGLQELENALSPSDAGGTRVLGTTLVGAAVSVNDNEYSIHLAWVGDSEAWLLDHDGDWTKIAPVAESNSDSGLITGRTSALPATEPHIKEIDISVESGRLFLMTDGVGTPLSMNTEVQTTLAEWWQNPPDPFTFASQVGFARKSFMDDRTVAGLWLSPIAPKSNSESANGTPACAGESSETFPSEVKSPSLLAGASKWSRD